MKFHGNQERLTKLLELLLTINPAEFHMDFWDDCEKSTRCAVGFAMNDEWFQGEGLRPFPEPPIESRFYWPVYADTAGFHAVGRFFNLPRRVTAWLFATSAYTEEEHSDVQAIIRKLERLLSGEYIPVGGGFQLSLKGGGEIE